MTMQAWQDGMYPGDFSDNSERTLRAVGPVLDIQGENMRKILIAAALCIVSPAAFAGLADQLEGLVGYTIVDRKTIEGWYDNSERKEGVFNGCTHGRVIVFTDNRILTCAQYGYQYSYRPTAVILSNGSQFKMVVGDEIYDMRR